jgi:HSP20 family protein
MTSHSATAASGTNAAGEAPTFMPPVDIFETKDALIMLLEMPGADTQTLDVTLDKHELTVSAQSPPFAPTGYTLVHDEYRDGNYERAVALSDQIDSERIDAEFKDGVLRLTLPKATPSPAKKIAVKSA